MKIVFNPSPCPSDLLLKYPMNLIYTLVLNEHEAKSIYSQIKQDDASINEISNTLMNKYTNLKMIVVTLGGDGVNASVRRDDGEIKTLFQSAIKTDVVDTVGAGIIYLLLAWLLLFIGDTFVGFFIGKLISLSVDLQTDEINRISKALYFASVAGIKYFSPISDLILIPASMACEKNGAMDSIPKIEEVEDRIFSL